MRGIILPFIFICLALGCKDREAVGETAVIDSAGIKYHKLKADTAELRKIGTEWEYIFERDQALRVKYGALFTEGKMDKKDEQRVIDSMNKNDSLNLVFVEQFIREYGWPAKDLVGNRCSETFFLVIQHAPHKHQVALLPVIVDAISRRSCDRPCFALLFDRILIGCNRKQYYGTQLFYDQASKKYKVRPLADARIVEELRRSVDLYPLDEYLKSFNEPEEAH